MPGTYHMHNPELDCSMDAPWRPGFQNACIVRQDMYGFSAIRHHLSRERGTTCQR